RHGRGDASGAIDVIRESSVEVNATPHGRAQAAAEHRAIRSQGIERVVGEGDADADADSRWGDGNAGAPAGVEGTGRVAPQHSIAARAPAQDLTGSLESAECCTRPVVAVVKGLRQD